MGQNKRFLCIHGHFYQPPRENPWLDRIERQESAAPFHNWNERILSECYYPNSASRILDEEGKICSIVNNYSWISFNIGPTLLSWIENESPGLYKAILEADRESIKKFSGHGNAIAQAYNHTILPLDDKRDKKTQVLWGIKDFKHRFKRDPEGIWLPELAVDTETLEVLADAGIKFIILSQYQAHSVKKIGESSWKDAGHGHIDTTRAYRVQLDQNRHIDAFFYNAEIARGVAFERLLDNGGKFLEHLKQGFKEDQRGQLVNIATDGESYGHHHRFGEMALSYALSKLEGEGQVQITNYGEFLEKFPPQDHVQIAERSSWSCAHGVGRWKEDCGCSTGGGAKWNQKWRKPLRSSLNLLKNEFNTIYQEKGRALFREPWTARDDYVRLLLDKSDSALSSFFSLHQVSELSPAQRSEALELLEMQRFGMFMFTSCGWFFNDVSGLETIQILEYASKGITHARKAGDRELEKKFLAGIDACRSNISCEGSGKDVFSKYIPPHVAGTSKLVAQYTLLNHIFGFLDSKKMFGYEFLLRDYRKESHRGTSLSIGHVSVRSLFTHRVQDYYVCCLYMGGFDFICKVDNALTPEEHSAGKNELFNLFSSHRVSDLTREIGVRFKGMDFSVSDIFYEERVRILNKIIEENVSSPEKSFFELYDSNKKLLDFFKEISVPVPPLLKKTTELALHQGITHVAENILEVNDVKRIGEMLADAERFNISTEKDSMSKKLEGKLVKFLKGLPDNREKNIHISLAILELGSKNDLDIDLWHAQNCYFAYVKELREKQEHLNDKDLEIAVYLNFSTKNLKEKN